MGVKTSPAARDMTRERKKSLLPILQSRQKAEGYLSPESIKLISRTLRISENEIYGVATFFPQFRFQPPGKYNIQVCLGNACHVGGGQNFVELMKIKKNIGHGETTQDGKFSLEGIACLGCCAIAPVVLVNDKVHGRMNLATFLRLLDSLDSSSEAEESSEALGS